MIHRLPRIAFFVFSSFSFFPTSVQGEEFRTLTGSMNNLTPGQVDWGSAGQNLLRMTSPAYSDGVSTLNEGPNVRSMSNRIFEQTGSIQDPRGLSQFNWAWGQFLAHDTDLTPLQDGNGAEHIDVPIPHDDAVFHPSQSIPVTRSIFDPNTGIGDPRQHPNVISSFVDASMVYGGASDESNYGQDRANWLRDPAFPGRLRVTKHMAGDLLPQKGNDVSAPGMAMDERMGDATFVAGDRRANEHAVLATMHTLFVREHNRIADLLHANDDLTTIAANAGLTVGDYVYERSRKIVGAEIQAITYNEYLPSLGVQLEPYSGYDDTVNPTVSPEFAVAAFRLGHTQVNGIVPRLDASGQSIAAGDLDLTRSFFDPSSVIDGGGISPIVRGLAATAQEATDAKMRDGLRNLLFGPPTTGPVSNGSDLAALNTIRGRDHGLPSFTQVWTELMGHETVPTTFADLISDPAIQESLSDVYGSVDQVDLWVGLLCEEHGADKSVGTLTELILADQFQRLRDGDRFYYQNDPDLRTWNTFDQQRNDAQWLSQLSLSDIVSMNTNVQSVQDNVFFAVAVPEPSARIMALIMTLGALIRRRAT